MQFAAALFESGRSSCDNEFCENFMLRIRQILISLKLQVELGFKREGTLCRICVSNNKTMLQSMALPQLFLGTRLPASEFAIPSNSQQLRKSGVRAWPRDEVDTLEAHPNTIVSFDSPESGRSAYLDKDNGSTTTSQGEEYEERRYQAPKTKRDVWVKPGTSHDAMDIKREKEVAEKYLWVNPNRKDRSEYGVGSASWPERRAGIEVLHSAGDVAAALLEVGHLLEVMDLNSVMRSFGKAKLWRNACLVFDYMKENNKLSPPTYTSYFSMLGKAGLAQKAIREFNELPRDSEVRLNVYVCNSVLSTMIFNGKVDKAFKLFGQLKSEGLKPDSVTYSTVISGCAKTRDGYTKANAFIQEIKNGNLVRDAVIYGAMMNVCAAHGMEKEVEATFTEMCDAGCTPNLFHYSSLLNTYAGRGKYQQAERVLQEIRAAGLTPNLVVYNSLLNAYANCQMADKAREVFEKIEAEGLQRDVVSFCSMMDAYGKAGMLKEAHETLDMMIAMGMKPGSVGYSILISAYAKAGKMDGVLKLVDQMEKGQSDILLFNTLLKVYCNVGCMDGVTAILRKMDSEGCGPDRGTFNILIGYFAKEDLGDLALKTLEDMKIRGHQPNEATYNALFLGYIKNGKMEDLRKTIVAMKRKKISPTNLSLQTIISGFLEHQQIDDVLATLPDLKATGNVLSLNVMEKLMHVLVEAGHMDAAMDALHLMQVNRLQPSQRTWDLILQKYASLGEYGKLLQLLEELKDVGVTASANTYSQLLKQVSESEKAVNLLDDLTDTVPAL